MTSRRNEPRPENRPHEPAAIAASFGLILALLGLGPGCHPSAEESEGLEPGAASGTEAGKPVVKEDPDQELGKELNRLLAERVTPAKKLENLRLFLKNVKLAEATAGKRLTVVTRTEREVNQLEKSLGDEAAKEFEKLGEKLRPLMEGPEASFTAAGSLVDAFPAERFKGTAVEAKVDELKARIILCQRAELEFSLRKDKLGDDPVKNIALLEGFDPAFASTPCFEQVQKLIKENYKNYVVGREVKAAQELTAKWEDLSVRSCHKIWPVNYDYTQVKDDALFVGPNQEEYLKEASDPAEAFTCIRFGEPEWIDVEIRFEAQITDPGNIRFGARGYQKEDVYDFSWKRIGELGIDDQEWHPIVVRIEKELLEITATGKKSVENPKIRQGSGPFAIQVLGPKAAINLRKIQVWVINREAPPEGSEKKGSRKKSKKASP
jgi:hypothetical protein